MEMVKIPHTGNYRTFTPSGGNYRTNIYKKTRKTPHTGNSRTFNLSGAWIDLLDIKKVCDKLDVPFFLEYGTLLGAVREHEFIEGDTDIDIGVIDCPKRELILDRLDHLAFYERTTNFRERVDKKFLSNDHYNICVNRNVIIDFRFYRLGVDIFPDHYVDGLGYYAWPKKYSKLMNFDFKSHIFLIQKDYEGFLEWNFPGDWRVPRKQLSRAVSFVPKPKRFNKNWQNESMRISNEWYEKYKESLK